MSNADQVVLVVEDDTLVREAAARALERAGYRVLAYADPSDALAAAGEKRVDLLLSDVVLPGMSGPDLAARLWTSCPEMRVLYMSGYGEGARSRHGIRTEGVKVLAKPFAPAALVREAETILRGVEGSPSTQEGTNEREG